MSPQPLVPFPFALLPRYRRWSLPPPECSFAQVSRPRRLVLPRGIGYAREGDSYWAALAPLARQIEADIIHAHQPYPDGYAGWRLKQRTGKPLVITIHGDPLLERIQNSPRLRELVTPALRGADAIITVASYQKAACAALGVEDLGKVVNIPNGVDTELFGPAPDRAALRRQVGLPPDKRLAVYVGSLYAPKGLPTLLESVARLETLPGGAPYELVIVGDGPLRAELQAQARQSGAAGRLRWVGRKPHDEVARWLAAADVMVLPSYQEGFPTVIPESLSCGVPVVATKVGGIPDAQLEPECGIMVPARDADALAQALGDALTRQWNTARIVAAGQRYSWRNIAERTFQVYRQALAAR